MRSLLCHNDWLIKFTLNEEDSGLIAYINKGKPGKVLAFRTDMDALPIAEETGTAFTSEHEGMAAFAADSAAKVVGSEKVLTQMKHPLMGSDDFSCCLEETPGAYLFLSSSNPEKGTDIDHHSCRFNIDEDVLWEGTAVFSQIAEDFLA